jgi:hypothetical protein
VAFLPIVDPVKPSAKMEGVLEVYERPYELKRPVVCINESNKEMRETPHGTLLTNQGKTNDKITNTYAMALQIFS